MTIKTKLLINILLPVGILLLIILAMISFQRHRGETERTNDIAFTLLEDMLTLSQRTDAYLLLGETQARAEWHRVYRSASLQLDQLHFQDNDENPIVERIRLNLRDMDDLFSRVADEGGAHPASDEASEDRGRQEEFSRQISMKSGSISSDALTLYLMSRTERNRHAVRLHALVLTFFLLSLAVSAGTLVTINRSIGGAIAKLTSGAETVGSGNLEHKIDLRTRDELGRLSRAFDAMTESLKTTTVSRDALMQEVAQRKEAEAELRKARDDLDLRVRERTEELQDAYENLVRESEERKQAEEQLHQSQKMEALGTMAGGIAHDFNNILAAMIGFTELIRDHLPEESREIRHADMVLTAGTRGRELVRQMLAFSRKNGREHQPLRLSDLIEETMGLLRSSIPTSIDIRVDVKSESGPILANPVQIQQIIMNLCNNAAHAMRRKGGVLTIELSDFEAPQDGDVPGLGQGSYIRLAVIDTGEGMPPELLGRAFDPFFTTKAPGQGTGLGLSVVRSIVASYNGAITVKSSPGEGTEFAVYFIKVEEKHMQDIKAETPVPTGHERILFVDDEEMLVEMGKAILEDLGYQVTGMTSGDEALELWRQDPARFDLIITDETMPGITGLQLVEEVRSIRDIPAILITGFSNVIDGASVNDTGLNAFMTKPLTRHELASAVRKVLDKEGVRNTG